MDPALNPYKAQLKRLRTRLNDPTYQSRIPVIQNRINKIRTGAGVAARDFTDWKPRYQQTTPAPAPTPTTPANPEPAIVQEYMPALQPEPTVAEPAPVQTNTTAFQTPPATEVKNYTASPMYEWQRQQAQKALNEQLSARGLYDSGVALQANQDMMQQLLANEVERQQKVEEWKQEVAAANANRGQAYSLANADRSQALNLANADRAQAQSIANANRLWDILSSEASRRDVLGQNQFTNKMTLLNYLANQNPMRYVGSSINDSATLQAQLAKYVADYMSQAYPQLFQYLPNVIPDFYATGDTGGSQASQAGASNNA